MESMVLKFTPVNTEMSLTPFKHVWLALLGLTASPNSPSGGFNAPLAATHPLHLPLPLPPAHPL